MIIKIIKLAKLVVNYSIEVKPTEKLRQELRFYDKKYEENPAACIIKVILSSVYNYI